MSTTIYTKPACIQCEATQRLMEKLSVEFTTRDISDDPDARDYLMSLGYLQAPVVITDSDTWSGFRPDRIKALAAQAA